MPDYNTTTVPAPTGNWARMKAGFQAASGTPGTDPSSTLGGTAQGPLTPAEILSLISGGASLTTIMQARFNGALSQQTTGQTPLPITTGRSTQTTPGQPGGYPSYLSDQARLAAQASDAFHNRSAPAAVPATTRTELATATAQDLLTSLYSLPSDQIIALQRRLWDGGFYAQQSAAGAAVATRPSWGIVDEATRNAYMDAMQLSLLHPDRTLNDTINARGSSSFIDRQSARKANLAAETALLNADRTASITSTDTLNTTIDVLATQLLGHGVTADERAKLIASVQGKETAAGQSKFDASARAAQIKAQGVADSDVDRFVGMAGTAGITGDWAGWLKRLGMPADTPMTGDNLQSVAHEVVLDYYDQFHNWRDVATAYLAAVQNDPGQHPGSGGHPSFGVADTQGRADQIAHEMNQPTPGLAGMTTGVTGGQVTSVETVNATDTLGQQLRAAHPLDVAENTFIKPGGALDSFKQMLNGWLVPG